MANEFILRKGLISLGGTTYPYKAVTTTYTIGVDDQMIDCTSGTFNVTLPTAVSITGKLYTVKNSGTGTITINTTSSQTIDGSLTKALLQYQSLNIESNGTNWIVTGTNTGGGNGTPNTLAKFTGIGTTIGDSVILESSGRISVGAFNSSAKFEVNTGTLGTSQYNYLLSQSIYSNNGNGEYFEMGPFRTSAGADWTSAGFRIQEKIDSTWMGYMQFNGDGNNGGITFGTGQSSVSKQSILERMRIDGSGVITIPGNVGMGTTLPTAKLNVKSTGSAISANTLFTDNYSRSTLSPGGTPSVAYSLVGSNPPSITTIGSTNVSALTLSSPNFYNYSAAVWPIIPTVNYNSQLNLNSATLQWTVNTHQSFNGTMSGLLVGSQTAQAVVLACSEQNPASTTAKGYALVYGNLGTNVWSLCSFTTGLNSTAGSSLVTIVSSPTVADVRSYISLKVTFVPATSQWTLYYRADAANSGVWANPLTGTYTSISTTVVNSTNVSIALPYFSFVYVAQGGNGHFGNFSLTNINTVVYPDSLKTEDGNFRQGVNGFTILENLQSLNAVDDAAAAALNVPTYGVYRTGNILRLRIPGITTDNIVYTTGSQTITGAKTFTANIQITNTAGSTIGFDTSGTTTATISANTSQFQFTAINTTGYLFKNTAGSNTLTIDQSGNVTALSGFFGPSDIRLKNIIEKDGDTIKFTWKDKRDDKTHIGYIAQEVQEKYPDQVSADTNGMLTVNYIEVLVAKIQELENRIKQLEK